ncbi:hypothetical protein [Nonomuraea zeae]|uniref:Uncharacterized protein n=1 Tax=Nonomuraea zeae TaxID=1642303 RepID=A0A5S4F9Z6_9ACTN|nr:hypothetical protein [Nonomuraea zeae]TMR13898.1 hypothetical protein ETD85_57275 [Nonomuraea zeae]
MSDHLLSMFVPKSTAAAACSSSSCYGCYNEGCGCQGVIKWKGRYCKQCRASTCIWVFSHCVYDVSCV